ncbi:MAG: hypothetical protein LBT51_04490, partial [Fusobacteriaceae bacterium]|nr:hypothetical protein [Fusobacteriaceae bacterium]
MVENSKLKEEKIFDILKTLILNANIFKNLKCIGIMGSIGRKEKSILISNLNDVDFFVIADEADQNKKIELEKKLNDFLGTTYTDILFVTLNKIKNIYK